MSWDKLSMADRAKYIKLAVDNGIYDISHIRDTYNSYTSVRKLNGKKNNQ